MFMQTPLEISYRNIEKDDSIDDLIRQKTGKLEQVCDYLISCHVAVEKTQEHQRTGNPYRVRIDMRVPPGHELTVRKEPTDGDMHDPLDVVIRRTFKVARRKLRDLVEKQRGEIKKHPKQRVNAIVNQVFRKEGYGFLKTIDEKDVYFHKNSVLHNDFDRLQPGTGVHYIEEQGEKGPQATSVQIMDKPGHRVSTDRVDNTEPVEKVEDETEY